MLPRANNIQCRQCPNNFSVHDLHTQHIRIPVPSFPSSCSKIMLNAIRICSRWRPQDELAASQDLNQLPDCDLYSRTSRRYGGGASGRSVALAARIMSPTCRRFPDFPPRGCIKFHFGGLLLPGNAPPFGSTGCGYCLKLSLAPKLF